MSNLLIEAAQKAVATLVSMPKVGQVYGQRHAEAQEAALKYLGTVLAAHNFATPAQIQAARDEHVSEIVEIDEPALISQADDGYWVQAWVWVYNDEEEDK